jgi:fructose-1,6-bisphosphatase/inositol monophosphatase family enzyme
MKEVQYYGELNPHLIGLAMKDILERALRLIVSKKTGFVAKIKAGKTGLMDDVLTDADTEAQAMMVSLLLERFPFYGIVAEEEDPRNPGSKGEPKPLVIPSSHPEDEFFFTIDPVDGTKAFVRRQSHGVASMLSLVKNGEVIAAYVMDVGTWELFGFRPESEKVHKIIGMDHGESLVIDTSTDLAKKIALLRDPLDTYSELMQRFIGKSGVVRSHNIEGGSIGMSFTHLWLGYMGMVVLHPGFQTPWDLAPVLGISQKMGFKFLEVDPATGLTKFWEPLITMETFETKNEIVVVHASDVGRVRSLLLRSR